MSGSYHYGERSPLKSTAATCRMDSCMVDPQQELLVAYREDNIRCFVDLLNDESVDVNKCYMEENQSTILQVAVEDGNELYVREILRNRDVNPNLPHKVLRRCPLHAAAEKGCDNIVQLLLEHGADVNAKLENGNTALHIAALRSAANSAKAEDKEKMQNKYLNIVNILLARNNVNFDAENTIECTPLYYAAEKGSPEVVKTLLKKGACITAEVDGETAEDLIRRRMPTVLQEVNTAKNRRKNDTIESQLFKALYAEISNPGGFLAKCRDLRQKVNWDSDDGGYTFLQYACDMGYDEIADYLLEEGADPNHVGSNNRIPAIVWAAHHGYHRVLKVFKRKFIEKGTPVDFSATDNNVKKENVLHKILKAESKAYANKELRSYTECLKVLLLDETESFKNNIAAAVNAPDNLGNSPLHIAAQSGNHEAVRRLLRSGANIGLKNFKGETPIVHIAPDIMEEFLDDCLVGEGQITDKQFKITFSYSFLGPPLERQHAIDQQPLLEKKTIKELPETEPLWYMSQIKEHRHLMNHPVITSFLWMKWRRIRPYFYLNLLMYVIFTAFLTTYCLLITGHIDTTEQTEGEEPPGPGLTISVIKWITFVGLVAFSLRELFQMAVSFRRYIFSIENIGEICLLLLTFILLFFPATADTEQDDVVLRHIAGIVILLSWTEFVLLVGRHPRLSTYIAMFSKVSRNFISFLTWFAALIIAFGLCFYIILHQPPPPSETATPPILDGSLTPVKEEEPVNAHFANPATSLMKTIVMSLTGELEFESIEFSATHVGRIIFVLYIFFIMLVLVNLLNGLAISDISAIQLEAEIVSCVSRVELISYIESILLGDPFQFLTNFPESRLAQQLPSCNLFSALYRTSCMQRFLSVFGSRRFLLFAEQLAGKQAVFYPNSSKKEKSGKGTRRTNQLILSNQILEDAKGLLVKKNSLSEGQELRERIDKMERTLRLLAQQQNFIISKL